jgi:hypothetical protein
MKQPTLPGRYQASSNLEIDASQAEVWALLAEFSTVSQWAPQVKESHAIGKGERCVGAGRHCELDGFGAIDEIITTWEEGTGFVYSVSPLGPLDKAFSAWWLTPIGNDRCRLRVTLSYDLRFGAFGKMMHSLVMRKKLEASLPDTLAAVNAEVLRTKESQKVAA